MPKVTLEQWQTLIAVVDNSGYAAAAEAMNKSQSSISYGVQKLENMLNVQVLKVEGRKAVLTGTDEALLRKEADIVIGGRIPPGFMGDPILDISFIAVASPTHPLHKAGHTLDYQDLRLHRQIVVSDSGSRDIDSGWLGSEQRLTVTNIQTSITAACQGLGYAWYPALKIQHELDNGLLKALPLSAGGKKNIQLSMIYADGNYAGPATRMFGQLLQQRLKQAEALHKR